MNRTVKLLPEHAVYQPLAIDPRSAAKGLGLDLDPEMGLAFSAGADMARVKVRFVDDVERRRRERVPQFPFDRLRDAHAGFCPEGRRICGSCMAPYSGCGTMRR